MAFLCRSVGWHEVGAQQASAWGREGPGSGSAREAEKGGHQRPSGFKPGRQGCGEKGEPAGKSGLGVGSGRIALQYALNKSGHLDLIGSNALFSDPICLSPAKFGGQRRPIVGPSFCKSIPVRVLTLSQMSAEESELSGGTADHEKEGSGRQGKQNSRPTPPTPHPRKRKQA